MTSTASNPADQEWPDRIRQLSPVERENRTKAVDVLLEKPQELNDILEAELWILRSHLQDRS